MTHRSVLDALDAAARLSEKSSAPRNTKADGMAPIPGEYKSNTRPGLSSGIELPLQKFDRFLYCLTRNPTTAE